MGYIPDATSMGHRDTLLGKQLKFYKLHLLGTSGILTLYYCGGVDYKCPVVNGKGLLDTFLGDCESSTPLVDNHRGFITVELNGVVGYKVGTNDSEDTEVRKLCIFLEGDEYTFWNTLLPIPAFSYPGGGGMVLRNKVFLDRERSPDRSLINTYFKEGLDMITTFSNLDLYCAHKGEYTPTT